MHSHQGYMNTPQPCDWDNHKQRAVGFTLRGGEWHGDFIWRVFVPKRHSGKAPQKRRSGELYERFR